MFNRLFLVIAPLAIGLAAPGCAAETAEDDESDGTVLSDSTDSVDEEPDDEGEVASTSSALVAPSCVKLSEYKRVEFIPYDSKTSRSAHWEAMTRVVVTNRCSSSQRLRVIFAWASDTSCFTLGSGKKRTEDRLRWGTIKPYVSELRRC